MKSKTKKTKPIVSTIEIHFIDEGVDERLITNALRMSFESGGDAEEFYQCLQTLCCQTRYDVETEIELPFGGYAKEEK